MRSQFLKAGTVLENFLKGVKFDLRRKWIDEEMTVGNFKEKINLASRFIIHKCWSNIHIISVVIVF